MTYRGTVKGGVIIPEPGARLDEGEAVEIRPLANTSSSATDVGATLYQRYQAFIGIAEGLPADFAENHDHYIHGTPKRDDAPGHGDATKRERSPEGEGAPERER